MTNRVERLTNLLALLLETVEPLSLVEISGELASQYPTGTSARRAAFERDKAALREIGVPIEQEVVGGGEYAGQTRYWIDRDRYELADLRLEDDERRALQVAMAATRPGSASGQEALWKLGAGLLDYRSAVQAVVPDMPALPTVREAVSARNTVSFTYRDVDRTVEPWGLLLRDGFWYLIGFDHQRGGRRTYRIDRIAGDVVRNLGTSFDRPPDFDPREAFPEDPKLIGADEKSPDALVLVDAVQAAQVVRDIGESRVIVRHDDGSVELSVVCANMPAFRSWLFGYGDSVEVIEPPDIRQDIVDWLTEAVS